MEPQEFVINRDDQDHYSLLGPNLINILSNTYGETIYPVIDSINYTTHPQEPHLNEEKEILLLHVGAHDSETDVMDKGFVEEQEFIKEIFSSTKPTKDWQEKYRQEQKKVKREDREKCLYESEATSEDAKVDNLGNNSVVLHDEPKLCMWSPENKLHHIQKGKKGLIPITASFRDIECDPLVDEYMVRFVLIRANMQHRQYPVDEVCHQHTGPNPSREDRYQVLQAKPGTSSDKFWYTYDGLRKSIIFEAPRPDASGNITVKMQLVCLCCDSCDAASVKYKRLVESAGKEAGRDWLLVTTLETRQDERQTIIARDVKPCWFKANVNQKDLDKTVRRKIKGGGAQKANRLKREAENSNSLFEPLDQKYIKIKSDLDEVLATPPEGKRLLKPATSVIVKPRQQQSCIQLYPSVIELDWRFHAKKIRQHLRSGKIDNDDVMKEIFGIPDNQLMS